MAEAIRHRDDTENVAEETPALALLANGSSGRWSVTLDESTEGGEGWYLQIEGPSLHLFCEVGDPCILHELAALLGSPDNSPNSLVVGRANNIPLRFLSDVEYEEVLFVTVGPASRPLLRCTIPAGDAQDLKAACQQAALDLVKD